MLYGTGKMLQLTQFAASPSPLKQMLFEAFQIMEANRAIMYGVDTFLSERHWVEVRRNRLLGSYQAVALPLNDMVDLIIHAASFTRT
jgi:hypothetical protein